MGSLPPFDDRQAKLFALRSFFDRVIPGRWDDLRSVRDDELDMLTVFSIPVEEVSAKIRNEFPATEAHMPADPVWTGTVPMPSVFLKPVADPRFHAQPTPQHLVSFAGEPDFAKRVDRA